MRISYTLFSIFCLISLSFAQAQDSTDIKTIDGKEFFQHRVREKETLYSLSRKYDVPIYRIIEHNPPTEFGLEVGTLINVPVKKEIVKPEPIVQTVKVKTGTPEPITDKPEVLSHVVETKQTLFSISKLYDVSVEDLRDWNDLPSNALDIGQVLLIRKLPKVSELPEITIPRKDRPEVHIVEQGETFYSLSKRFGISVEDLKSLNGLVSNELSVGQELLVRPSKVDNETIEVNSDETDQKTKRTDEEQEAIDQALESARKYEEISQPMNFEEVVESGVAEVIQGTSNTRKYLALHRTAKAGTILKVTNDMNDQEVFVRVLGKLPDNLTNNNILIKISQAAYNRLGAIDPKFRVTISYIP